MPLLFIFILFFSLMKYHAQRATAFGTPALKMKAHVGAHHGIDKDDMRQ